MTVITTSCCFHDVYRLFNAQTCITSAKGHHHIFTKTTFTIGNCFFNHTGDFLLPLNTRHLGRFAATKTHIGYKILQNYLFNACFTQRRQHALDVTQEHTVRSNDQNALVFQRKTMRVQQIGGTMQGDNSLPCARATLHHQHTTLW